jgi:hypothetical protein
MLKVEQWPIDRLIEYARKMRLPQEQLAAVAQSDKQVGRLLVKSPPGLGKTREAIHWAICILRAVSRRLPHSSGASPEAARSSHHAEAQTVSCGGDRSVRAIGRRD